MENQTEKCKVWLEENRPDFDFEKYKEIFEVAEIKNVKQFCWELTMFIDIADNLTVFLSEENILKIMDIWKLRD